MHKEVSANCTCTVWGLANSLYVLRYNSGMNMSSIGVTLWYENAPKFASTRHCMSNNVICVASSNTHIITNVMRCVASVDTHIISRMLSYVCRLCLHTHIIIHMMIQQLCTTFKRCANLNLHRSLAALTQHHTMHSNNAISDHTI